ncbi:MULTISPECIES: hypothetical protein [unclassified Neochlamydia]|uniref:hypothetical protein n=1 Tax=unclassified Neochlamydia TaxID=2643326 RepID=UPI0014096779|nr:MULTISPECIES: hypothetical protein [unclassified Neochlamydia]
MEKKFTYSIRPTSKGFDYNEALVQRGSLTLGFIEHHCQRSPWNFFINLIGGIVA